MISVWEGSHKGERENDKERILKSMLTQNREMFLFYPYFYFDIILV